MADVGSFCARFWRAGAYAREAGGIGSREAFYEGYASIAGEGSIDAQRIAFWEFHATLKAGIDAITGAQVFLGSDVDWYTHEGWRVRAIAAQYDLLMDLAQVALVGR